MKFKSLSLKNHQTAYREHRNKVNAKHILMLTRYVILFEFLFILIALFSYHHQRVENFPYMRYILMYTILICISFAMNRSAKYMRSSPHFYRLTTLYAAFFISWGLIVSLLDQALYGHLNAFYINIVAIMAIVYMEDRDILLLYLGETFVLFVFLPSVQVNQDVLVGHYVNTIVFILFMVIASHFHHKIFKRQFITNNRLKAQIKENDTMAEELKRAVEKLETLVIQDDLTGLPNRRGLEEFIRRISQMDFSDDVPYSLMMIDIDYFKDYNDTYGHPMGDEALRAISKVLSSELTSLNDYVIRYGGEEFLQVCIDKDSTQMPALAEKLRLAIEAIGIEHRTSKCADVITISIGIASSTVHSIDRLSEVLTQADKALYDAKTNGRNQYAVFDQSQNTPSSS
ncbi:GGDEF domain-containing protein [Fusibacter paucivorans]|uniref:GGDEF domain-containing protein n=1 Tax=Fusibacter paucivorans TaxID=76009 RepID=A0ABS5PL12_9FIRM|nr:GGDEF domain-containing protein [Fusibacter paucivorans]MBS7525738.1 GGDEF domain-containing protein [Fusibacter paucivorans]